MPVSDIVVALRLSVSGLEHVPIRAAAKVLPEQRRNGRRQVNITFRVLLRRAEMPLPVGFSDLQGSTIVYHLRIPMMVMGASDLIVMVISERNDHHDRSEATPTFLCCLN